MKKKRKKGLTETVEMVGDYEFTVRFAETSTPEAEERWARRSEVLARWLLDMWKREQAVKAAQENAGPSRPPGTK